MTRNVSISLQNRLALTYALFTGIALAVLTVIVNIFTSVIFTALVKDNIAVKSAEIARTLGGQYSPASGGFDAITVEAVGMYFVHEGYIVTLEDASGGLVWGARFCDMRECMAVISGISARMEGRFGIKGAMRTDTYPVPYAGKTVGSVTIETYGPFFYSETESAFLTSINRLLLTATVILTLFSLAVSVMLSRAIARPVNRAASAARQIATRIGGGPPVWIDDKYRTKELAELARSINDLAAALEAGECRQKQLTGDIAHELRTPLTCLRGDIEAMIDGVYKPDRERLESCHEEIMRLARLVNDLDTLTGLEWENLALEKTEFDLASLLRVTVGQFRSAALEKGIEMRLDLAESPISADYDRLKQVFINLLSNAVKYTDTGGITLSVRKAGPSWEVAVADTGVGIPADDLPHIFERFYRADKSRSRDTGGAGIGLTIAAAIVRAHGGKITAESGGRGRGSVFKVIL